MNWDCVYNQRGLNFIWKPFCKSALVLFRLKIHLHAFTFALLHNWPTIIKALLASLLALLFMRATCASETLSVGGSAVFYTYSMNVKAFTAFHFALIYCPNYKNWNMILWALFHPERCFTDKISSKDREPRPKNDSHRDRWRIKKKFDGIFHGSASRKNTPQGEKCARAFVWYSTEKFTSLIISSFRLMVMRLECQRDEFH